MAVGHIVDGILYPTKRSLFRGGGLGATSSHWWLTNCSVVDNLLCCRRGRNNMLSDVLFDSFYEGRGDLTVDNWLDFFNNMGVDRFLNNSGVGNNRGTRGGSLIRVFLDNVDFRSVNFTVNNRLNFNNLLRADGLLHDSGADVGLDNRGGGSRPTLGKGNPS